MKKLAGRAAQHMRNNVRQRHRVFARHRALMIGFLAAVSAPHGLSAQLEIVDNLIDDRVEALNAVLHFRNDLTGDSTWIAPCSFIPEAIDSTAALQIDDHFQGLYVDPADSVELDLGCGVRYFAVEGTRILWLQDLIEITRDGGPGYPPYRTKQFELTFQLLLGPGYREWHTYTVEPSGITIAADGESTQFTEFRVIEYRLSGWNFHWGDNLGHSSIVRRGR